MGLCLENWQVMWIKIGVSLNQNFGFGAMARLKENIFGPATSGTSSKFWILKSNGQKIINAQYKHTYFYGITWPVKLGSSPWQPWKYSACKVYKPKIS